MASPINSTPLSMATNARQPSTTGLTTAGPRHHRSPHPALRSHRTTPADAAGPIRAATRPGAAYRAGHCLHASCRPTPPPATKAIDPPSGATDLPKVTPTIRLPEHRICPSHAGEIAIPPGRATPRRHSPYGCWTSSLPLRRWRGGGGRGRESGGGTTGKPCAACGRATQGKRSIRSR